MDRTSSNSGSWNGIKKIFKSKPVGRGRMGRPRLRWLEDFKRIYGRWR
jgi:hypothetical protein